MLHKQIKLVEIFSREVVQDWYHWWFCTCMSNDPVNTVTLKRLKTDKDQIMIYVCYHKYNQVKTDSQ